MFNLGNKQLWPMIKILGPQLRNFLYLEKLFKLVNPTELAKIIGVF